MVAELYFAWWSVAVVAFLVMLLFNYPPGRAFLGGFAAIFLFWLLTAFRKDAANEHILAPKMAALFHLPNYALFILVIALVGGLVGGVAGWSGSLVRRMLQ